MRRTLIVSVLLLSVSSIGWAGTYTCVGEDAAVAVAAKRMNIAPDKVCQTLLDQVIKAQQTTAVDDTVRALQKACRRGDQPSCDKLKALTPPAAEKK